MGKVVAKDTKIERSVDLETGEINEKEISTMVIRKTVTTKEFMQIYLDDMSGLFKLQGDKEHMFMYILWKISEFNQKNSTQGNVIVALKEDKEKWATELDVTLGTVNNMITKLVNKDLLIKVSRSKFMLNPKYFFKGFMEDQPKVVRAILEYQIKNNG